MLVNSGLKILSLKTIDLNCDMGEGFGNDALIMPYISSANIACGFHAGDEDTMKRTIELCLKHNVAIGAHPSFPDRENFGRTDMLLEKQEVYDLIIKQIRILEKIAGESGMGLKHVKLHGALYNMAARDKSLAPVVSLAVKDCNPKLILYGLSGSNLIKEGKNIGLKTASEVFADRSYQDNGSLTRRNKPGALLGDTNSAVTQVLQMVNEETVTSLNGKKVPLIADTVCIHGDGVLALDFAKAIHSALKENNIEINPIS